MKMFLRLKQGAGARLSWWGSAIAATGFLFVLIGDGCVGDEPTDGPTTADDGGDSSTADSSSDGAVPPAQGFTMSISPTHVTGDPGDVPVVGISIVRAAGFSDPISFTVSPTLTGLTASAPPPTSNSGNSSTFTLSFAATIVDGDTAVTVTGSNVGGTFVQNATLNVHVGSLLDTRDGGLPVPSFATSLVVSAWGGGGGGAQSLTGSGGGGGYASGNVSVSGGQFYIVTVGQGGYSGGHLGYGGGGGGYSAFCPSTDADASACMVIAGGGGGSGASSGSLAGGSGGAGGGTSGMPGGQGGADDFCPVSGGGTQTGPGLAGTCSDQGGNGDRYLGGEGGGTVLIDNGGGGGLPGGGDGSGEGNGGGGAGYWGGAGGGFANFPDGGFPGQNGGGGGSGRVPAGGTLTAGNGAQPGGTVDPHCAANAGVGGLNSSLGLNDGNAGCVVVRLAKP